MLFIINDITNWTCTAVAFAFERVFRQTARHLLGEIGGIILCKALQDGFQQDAVCAGRNHLGCGNNADVVLLEQHLTAGIDSLRSSKKNVRNNFAIIQHAIADAKLIDDIALFTGGYAHFLSDILHVDL